MDNVRETPPQRSDALIFSHQKRIVPSTLSEHLAPRPDENIHSKPHPDLRFDPNACVLDAHHLRTSIVIMSSLTVTCVMTGPPVAQQSLPPKTPNIVSTPAISISEGQRRFSSLLAFGPNITSRTGTTKSFGDPKCHVCVRISHYLLQEWIETSRILSRARFCGLYLRPCGSIAFRHN